jgi:hypothetical protein
MTYAFVTGNIDLDFVNRYEELDLKKWKFRIPIYDQLEGAVRASIIENVSDNIGFLDWASEQELELNGTKEWIVDYEVLTYVIVNEIDQLSNFIKEVSLSPNHFEATITLTYERIWELYKAKMERGN